MSCKPSNLVALIVLFLLLVPVGASGANPAAALMMADAGGGGQAESVSIPPGTPPEKVQALLAGMSDEQVRRLLISELQNAPHPSPDQHQQTGIAGVILRSKASLQHVKERLSYLFSGAASAPRLLPDAIMQSLSGEGVHPPGHLLAGLVTITVMWFGVRFFVKRRMDGVRRRIEDVDPAAPLWIKIGRLLARALFDIVTVLIIAVVTLIPYLIIFNEPATGRPVIFAWFGAMLVVEIVRTLARLLLVPDVSAIRFLPLSDEAAKLIYKWTIRIAWIVSVGILLSSIIRMSRGSELAFLVILAITGLVVAVTISLVALWHSKKVADTIRRFSKENSLQYQLAGTWHVGVTGYCFVFWFFWVVALLVFGDRAMMAGVYTLLVVPLYFLVDWATQQLVRFAVDLADSGGGAEAASADGEEGASEAPAITRFQTFLSRSFRMLVFAAAVFLLLRIWGVNLNFGRATVSAGIDILLTLVLAYIFWIYISNYIEDKLRDKQAAQDDSGEGDGGGPGGDRFSTLLQLVKKFIFAAVTVVTALIILSSLGVDIGPLIAGASVFGIAIGFGAQTLVKDIISGIFFLMDDAFRVGDYIIVGSARGTVEQISVRSFKLRHHLGPLYTIPFGSIKEIQNMTRDWAVMKLNYLVPFDTDIHKIKKIIKKINKEIRAIPELNEFMLSDIKSQGVKAMEEYGMRMRVKFMTKPGGQFTLRKLVLAKMRKEFEAAGIEFAKPRVSVSLPETAQLSPEEAATVATAAAQKAVDEDQAKQQAKKK
ncbi:MscS Mechanosensitive ion channel [Pseudodesulfovibrio profundus]|uniref:MscS Mechanosensitive ion channel n=1 Tax=Pseudodesulfovibrio profundus TaxID=57320 RepID=A0A2C8FET1_9BACT|nr:mechanosensitive ion channel domain-containing protein [Pseudodesulfovibrio profundus]SOB60569.1 MscS Mechanosensitive ion channel [Pseudodesulfovibrio profundus]